MTSEREALIRKFALDKILAHRVVFAHRHTDESPPFHEELILDWHNTAVRDLCQIAFRGGAKSTIGEEGACLMAIYKVFRNARIIGSSLDLACERLLPIKREFERNEIIRELFGDLRGSPWSEEVIELRTGVRISAMGRGQSIRGTKTDLVRPDFVWGDDIEIPDDMNNPVTRDKIQRWFLGDVLPATDPKRLVRITANDLDPECLAVRLKDPKSGFKTRVYPILYKNEETGEERATWEKRYPVAWCNTERDRLFALGRSREWWSEYMCRSSSPDDKPFSSDMIRVVPTRHSWQPVYCMWDPARTTGPDSATTGFAAWSWVGNKMIVWEAWAKKIMPDEIIKSMFDIWTDYRPVLMGFEEDGLNEWALQPIRQEMVRRGALLPLKAVRAPKGKHAFIRGLQPWFKAKEVEFQKPLPDLTTQLIAFPTGHIDAPNALAYALHPDMKPGVAFYEDFTQANVAEEITPSPAAEVWLALNADYAFTTGVIVQAFDGMIRIFADYVREGEPSQNVLSILKDAAMEARDLKVVMPPSHWAKYTNVGLAQAVARVPRATKTGAEPRDGRTEIRAHLRAERRGMPALLIAKKATFTLNAFAGGYARVMEKGGVLSEFAQDGVYRVLMEGLESFLGLRGRAVQDDEARNVVYARTPQGREYVSALAGRGQPMPEMKTALPGARRH